MLQADASGVVATAVVPFWIGSIVLSVTDGTVTLNQAFQAGGGDVLRILSTPADGTLVGRTSVPFAVQLIADTSGGGSAKIVTLSVTNGVARLSACGSTSCALVADASGSVSTEVIPLVAGEIGVEAREGAPGLPGGLAVVGTSFRADALPGTIRAVEGETRIAEGAVIGLRLDALLSEAGGGAAAGQTVLWTAGSGWSVGTQSVSNLGGAVWTAATLGPLGAGMRGEAQVCAWSTVCASFGAVGVEAGDWRLSVVSGGGQMGSAGAAVAPVLALVTDGSGHPVAGVPVSVTQTVRAAAADCATRGRCPARPILYSQVTVVSADALGQVSVAPLLGEPGAMTQTETEIALSAGTQGFVVAVVWNRP